MWAVKKKLRVLDFDIENRPLSYWAPDMPTAEITAISSCWDDLASLQTCLLGVETLEEILDHFVERYNEADIVTGHYIRRHDLPHINGALLELGKPQLQPKLTIDTKMDMYKKQGIPATQEYLGILLNIPAPKIHMTQDDWREANRLTPDGITKTKTRVEGDVIQHMLMRNEMQKRGLLKAAKVWSP